MPELKIDEIGEMHGVRVICKEDPYDEKCDKCAFHKHIKCAITDCASEDREDGKSVYFPEVLQNEELC